MNTNLTEGHQEAITERLELKQAKGCIARAKLEGADTLILNSLRLTPEEFEGLLPSIKEIESLRKLELKGNKLSTLPEGIRDLNLRSLHLEGNGLEALPSCIGELSSLQILSLNNNKLSVLPDTIGDLTALITLSLKDNSLTALPTSIRSLTALRMLDLERNELESLPDTLGDLVDLKVLDLEHNRLTIVPESCGKLIGLEGLNLGGNKLRTLPNSIGELKSLQGLDVKGNNLDTLPDTIGELVNLSHFYLGNNALQTLPDSFSNLVSLEQLDLSENKLKTLPDTFGDLVNLAFLNVSKNALQALPDSMGELMALQTLNLKENQLQTLPNAMARLSPELSIHLGSNLLEDSALEMIANTFGDAAVATEGASVDLEPVAYALTKLYPETKNLVLDQMQHLNLGTFEIEENKQETPEGPLVKVKVERSSLEVLEKFLSKIPVDDANASRLYIPAAKSLLDTIFNTELEEQERQEALQKIATSLGDCGTPVQNFLTQICIGQHSESNGDTPEWLHDVIVGIAVEKAILQKFNQEFKEELKIEGAEKVQALRNSLLLKNSENMKPNKVKILHKANLQPSVSRHVSFGFSQITDAMADTFASMCCQTGPAGALITEGGKYLADHKKISAITEPYFAELGLVSQRERMVEPYKEALERLLSEYELGEHYDKDDVLELMNTTKHRDDFRTALLAVPDHEVKATFDRYLLQKELEISRLGIEYNRVPKSPLSAMTAVSGITRSASTAALKEVEKHSKRSSEKAEKPSRRCSV